MTRTIESEDADELPFPTVQRRKPMIFEGSGDDLDLVIGSNPTGELNLAVVLIGPEPRDRCEGLRLGIGGQETLCCMHALLDRIVPVLDPHHLVEAMIWPTRNITRCGDARSSEHGRITDDTVVDGEPRPLEPFGVRNNADTDDDEVGIDFGAIGQHNRRDAAPLGLCLLYTSPSPRDS